MSAHKKMERFTLIVIFLAGFMSFNVVRDRAVEFETEHERPAVVYEVPMEAALAEAAVEVEAKTYDVPLDEKLQRYIIGEAEEHGIDPAIVFAMAWKESRYTADAIGDGGDSIGLMQIQPKWHSERMAVLGCENLLDPHMNATVAIDLLAELVDKHGDIWIALTVYNAGHYDGYITEYAKAVMEKAEELKI